METSDYSEGKVERLTKSEKYDIILESLRLQTARINNWTTIFLTSNAFLSGALGFLIDKQKSHLIVPSICILGTLLSLIWYAGLSRIKKESDFRYAQLREIEGEGFYPEGNYSAIYQYFYVNGKTNLRFYERKRIVQLLQYVPFIFIAFYFIVIIFYLKW